MKICIYNKEKLGYDVINDLNNENNTTFVFDENGRIHKPSGDNFGINFNLINNISRIISEENIGLREINEVLKLIDSTIVIKKEDYKIVLNYFRQTWSSYKNYSELYALEERIRNTEPLNYQLIIDRLNNLAQYYSALKTKLFYNYPFVNIVDYAIEKKVMVKFGDVFNKVSDTKLHPIIMDYFYLKTMKFDYEHFKKKEKYNLDNSSILQIRTGWDWHWDQIEWRKKIDENKITEQEFEIYIFNEINELEQHVLDCFDDDDNENYYLWGDKTTSGMINEVINEEIEFEMNYLSNIESNPSIESDE